MRGCVVFVFFYFWVDFGAHIAVPYFVYTKKTWKSTKGKTHLFDAVPFYDAFHHICPGR